MFYPAMDYLYLLPLLILLYMVSVDPNVSEYLYLKLVKSPWIFVQMFLMKQRLLIRLRYDTFMMKRGHVPGKFYKMSKSIRDGIDPMV
jgi:hypothetical protein